jgi:hypothetical protein
MAFATDAWPQPFRHSQYTTAPGADRGLQFAIMSEPSYSISVRVQRVTTEDAYVQVPVNSTVMNVEPEPDGTYHLDTEKVWAEAVRLGVEVTRWRLESQDVTVHPVQQAPPEGAPEPYYQ